MNNVVISLTRTPDRLEAFKSANGHVPFVVFPAVDGCNLSAKELRGVFTVDSPPYTLGALGCFLSHTALWRRCVDEDRVMTIIEDDVRLALEFEDTSLKLMESISRWDIVLWGWNMNSVLQCEIFPGLTEAAFIFNSGKFLSNFRSWLSTAQVRNLYRVSRALGTPCYSITPSGARKLLAQVSPIRKMTVWFPLLSRRIANNGIDIMMNASYESLDAFVCLAPLALTPNDVSVSTVQTKERVRISPR